MGLFGIEVSSVFHFKPLDSPFCSCFAFIFVVPYSFLFGLQKFAFFVFSDGFLGHLCILYLFVVASVYGITTSCLTVCFTAVSLKIICTLIGSVAVVYYV